MDADNTARAQDQKLENLLNLALEATPEEREKSPELEIGYDRASKTWELIVRYAGSPDAWSREQPELQLTDLGGGYAVVRLPQRLISWLSDRPEVLFIEKPKRLYFENAEQVSCITQLQISDSSDVLQELLPPGVDRPLLGDGILLAALDSGVDYAHPEFRNPDGTSRILAIWDQTVAGSPPEGFSVGTEYTNEDIDEALRTGERLPTVDLSGHGTQVLGIAGGNSGAAPHAELLVVKLGNPGSDSFPKTTQLMEGLAYALRKAEQTGLPLVINLSFGSVYGPHNGTGLLEQYLDYAADQWKTVIVVGTGNEGAAAGHAAGRVSPAGETMVELGIAPGERNVNVQLWKQYPDDFLVSLTAPGGQKIGPLTEQPGAQRYTAGDTELLIYYGEPAPYGLSQELYFDFLPRESYMDSGIWTFHFTPRRIRQGSFDLWLPAQSALNAGTRFYQPSPENTITIPATATRALSVAAYDSGTGIYAPFSGRGAAAFADSDSARLRSASADSISDAIRLRSASVDSRSGSGQLVTASRTSSLECPLSTCAVAVDTATDISTPSAVWVKPDLAAPGVDITAPMAGGSYTTVSGTSFAAPFAAGAAAMLMQWGITDGNDPWLYGEKVKAYLRSGARPLTGFSVYPNNQVGYGTLCVRDSLPV